jgi:hypothetical protein
MSTLPPSSPQFEIRHSTSTIADMPEPKYMAVAYFCQRYHCAINEVEIVGINGGQFIDLDSMQARMIILRNRYR